jgi:DnaK suppressor protein
MDLLELETFKNRLVALRARLMRQVDASEAALREDVATPGDSSSVPSHPADSNTEGMDAEIAIAQNEQWLLEEVEHALERIEAGTFGVCRQCGDEIARQRLDALPYASCCVECARQNDQPPQTPNRGEPRRFR